jgi:hypothetical protein
MGMRGWCAPAIAMALLGAPATAGAATVSMTPPDPELDEVFALGLVEDGGSERNDLVVDGHRYGRLAVRERGRAPLRAGRGCRRRSARLVTCRIDEIVAILVRAGPGDDAIRCHGAYGAVFGERGDDTIVAGGECLLQLFGGRGEDRLVGDSRGQWLIGGAGRDVLDGGGGPDTLYGDGVRTGHARDALDGGDGVDVAAFDGERRRVRVDLSRGGGPDGDRLRGIENVHGSRWDDVLVGDDGPNRLRAGAGDDRIDGRGGRDVLDGGGGTKEWSDGDDGSPDRFRCGRGRDVVRYPEDALLPRSCELMFDFSSFDWVWVPAFPRAAGRMRVAVPAICPPVHPTEKCRHRAILRSGGRELGRSRLVSPGDRVVTWITVPLKRPLPRRRPVRIETQTQEYSSIEYDGWSGFGSVTWRIRCRGGPDCRGRR